jgi:hypothetical protein
VSEHWIVADWTCACGEDMFGGTAAYSALLWSKHLTHTVTTAAGQQESEQDQPEEAEHGC